MKPSDICVYICPDDRSEDSDTRIRRYAVRFLAEGQICETPPPIFRPAIGRPCFKGDGMPFFSVSHSGDLWACAISFRRVGLDIQRFTCERNIAGITRRFFHPEETAFLEQSGYNNFFSIWTAKESYVKYTGVGIDNNFSDFSAVDGSSLSDNINGVSLRHIKFNAAYVMCVCYDGCGEACVRVINESVI